jgi:hypothetical protein
MSITIELGPEEESKLHERASQCGQDVESYVHRLISRDIQSVEGALAPFRRQVEMSGISDPELREFFEEVREEVWLEKRGASGKAS